jgi:hypothetical protein
MVACNNCAAVAKGVCSGCKSTHYCSSGCVKEDWTLHASNCIGGLFGNKWEGTIETHIELIFNLADAHIDNGDVTAALSEAKLQGALLTRNFGRQYREPFQRTFVEIVDLWNEQIQEYQTRRRETNRSANIKNRLLDIDDGTPGSAMVDLLAVSKNNKADVQQAWTWLVECIDTTIIAKAQINHFQYMGRRTICMDGAENVENTFNGKPWVVPE